jgi:hypothetical protein
LSREENKWAPDHVKKTIDYPIPQTWFGEERIFILMAHPSCTVYLSKYKIGS